MDEDRRPAELRVPPAAVARIGSWSLGLVAVVMVTGIGATFVASQQAEDEADTLERGLSTEVAMLVEGNAGASVAALAAGGGLVSSQGDVELEAFEIYAREVVRLSPLEVLAYVPVVADVDRPVFESRIGQPIMDLRDGIQVPADQRPSYYPVQDIVPRSAEGRPVPGVDILADPVRGAAAQEARDTGRTVLTEPVAAHGTGEPSLFVVKPLYRTGLPLDTQRQRRTAHVGFLSTEHAGSNFANAIRDTLPRGGRFSLRDGEVLLATSSSPPSGGTTRTLEVGGRTWQLAIEDGREADRSLMWSLAAFTALLAGGLIIFFRRAEAHDRASRRSAQVIARTADVAQALAAAGTVEDVEEVVHAEVPAVLGAMGAGLGIVDRAHGVLRMALPAVLDPEVAARHAELPLTSMSPATEVVRTGEPVLLNTDAEWRAHASPEVIDDVVRSGVVTTFCLPLTDRHGQVAGTLSLSWDRPVDLDAPTLDTIRTLAELCEYTLGRARSTDESARQAGQLAGLAAELAGAATMDEVLQVITESASSPVDASATSIGLIDREAGMLRTHHGASVADEIRERFTDPPLEARLAFTDAARTGRLVLLADHAAFAKRYPQSASTTLELGFGARAALPLRDSDGQVVGSIVHAWTGPRVFDEALRSTLLTIADLAGQALERTGLSDAEHRLITTLQDRVLVPLPEATGLDIAACYLPAAEQIGMGGDWYEGIVLDDHRYALIVGDVAGHGITAVADMTQLRAVIDALVRIGTPIDEVFAQTTALVRGGERTPTASAFLAVIDTELDTVCYTAAGHPPAMVRQPSGGTQALDEGRQPILGIRVNSGAAAEAPFPPGSVLVAYTDGLIERRDEPIDRSIERLRCHIDAATETEASALAERLLNSNLDGREPDDDVALVVILRRPR